MTSERAIGAEPPLAIDAGLLGNLLELNIHDLSAAFDLDVGIDGRFGYAPLAHRGVDPGIKSIE